MAVVEHSAGRGRRGLVYLAVCLSLMLILALLGGPALSLGDTPPGFDASLCRCEIYRICCR